MDIQYKQRIDTILNQCSSITLFPEFTKGSNTCPYCKKRNKFYLYDKVVKCYSSSCLLHKPQNLISFYAWYNHLSFHQALLELEKSVGINNQQEINERHELLKEILSIYQYHLFNSKEIEGQQALDYLLSRGFYEQYIQLVGIGYAPSYNVLSRYGFTNTQLKKHHLLDHRNNDYFRNRIIFPIRSRSNQLVHLNGRYVGDIPVNDSDEPLLPRFKCSKTYQGKRITDYLLFEEYIKQYESKGLTVLTEGCTDSFTLHQYGIPVLGLLGIEKLSSHYSKLVNIKTVLSIFDNDKFDINHPYYPNQYKSWSRILPELIDLQFLLPQTTFKIWMVPSDQGKDINDYFNQKHNSANDKIDIIYKEAIDLVDFAIDQYKYNFDKHILLARLVKIKNKGYSQLNKIIPPDYSPLDYLLKVV